jgi:hypothetical protein
LGVRAGNFSPNHEAEQWVIEQIQRAGVADLKIKFPEEKDLRVSSALVAKVLLILGDSPGLFVIKNAVFVDHFVLEGINIKHGFAMLDCKFFDSVTIVNIESQGSLLFNGGRFKRPVHISGAKIHGILNFPDSIFNSSFYISDSEIDSRLGLDNVYFDSLFDEIEFTKT